VVLLLIYIIPDRYESIANDGKCTFSSIPNDIRIKKSSALTGFYLVVKLFHENERMQSYFSNCISV